MKKIIIDLTVENNKDSKRYHKGYIQCFSNEASIGDTFNLDLREFDINKTIVILKKDGKEKVLK